MEPFSAVQHHHQLFCPSSLMSQMSLNNSPLSQNSTPMVENTSQRYSYDTPQKTASQIDWIPFPRDLLFDPQKIQSSEGERHGSDSLARFLQSRKAEQQPTSVSSVAPHSVETMMTFLTEDRDFGGEKIQDDERDDGAPDSTRRRNQPQMSQGSRRQFLKTKMCPFLSRGKCPNEKTCSYAHSPDQLRPLPDLRRTKLCDETKKGRVCSNLNCTYAHAVYELKPTPDLLTYKTTLCFFWKRGKCFNGAKCRFAHGLHELRLKSLLPNTHDNQLTAEQLFQGFPVESHNSISNESSASTSITTELLKAIALDAWTPSRFSGFSSPTPSHNFDGIPHPLLLNDQSNLPNNSLSSTPLSGLNRSTFQMAYGSQSNTVQRSLPCDFSNQFHGIPLRCSETLSTSSIATPPLSPLQSTSATTPQMTPTRIPSSVVYPNSHGVGPPASQLPFVMTNDLQPAQTSLLPINHHHQHDRHQHDRQMSMPTVSSILQNLFRSDRS